MGSTNVFEFNAATGNQVRQFQATTSANGVFNGGGGGDTSPWNTGTIMKVAPTPSQLTPGATVTTFLPTLTWSAVAGATSYDVWVNNLTTGTSQILRSQTAGTSLTATAALTLGNSYEWWVRGLATGSNGPWSAGAVFTVTALATPVQLTPNGSIQVPAPTFTWNPVAGADYYDVWVDDTTSGQSQVLRNTNGPRHELDRHQSAHLEPCLHLVGAGDR